MKVVILAGGLGTRISEESQIRPKPMVEIGGRPILWHIMKQYSYYGYQDFIICCGYKGQVIKEYFANYYMHSSDVTFDFRNGNAMQIHNNVAEPWRVTLVDTGDASMTGGRIRRIQKYIPEGETFLMTYGDGVSDVNIQKLVDYHYAHGTVATVTAVQPGGRFGVMDIDDKSKRVLCFEEKPKEDGNWISGGFFVLDYKVFDYIEPKDETIFEYAPMHSLAADGQLTAYQHRGFWQPMDTLRDKNLLEHMWQQPNPPWRVWE
ncbi:MAG: glucose-1-phosphate cytidylyltransferase [Blautia sp.]|nr:glucose-1-phosphate cytidylyltransferase [Blautia sp.]MCM1237685.1 glucose-1-phosphate cytidylyltransferase [Ruminococcus flavefaciens]